MNKVLSKLLILFFILLILVFSCNKPKVSKNEYTLLIPKSTSSLPLLMAIEKGIMKDISFKYEFFSNHAQALSRLIRGEADFLYTGTTQGWENQKSGGPLVMVSTGVWGISYLMGKEDINQWSDLKGKKIVLPFIGSPLDYQTRAILINANLNPEQDLEISYGPFPTTIGLLAKGKADFAPLPEPLASRLELSGKLKRIFSYEKAWGQSIGSSGASPQVSLFTTQNFIKTDKMVVDALIKAWMDTNDQIKKNAESIARRFKDVLSFSMEEIVQSIQNSHLKVVSPLENKKLSFEYAVQLNEFFPEFDAELQDSFFYTSK